MTLIEIQDLYNTGKSWRTIANMDGCKYSQSKLFRFATDGKLQSRSRSASRKLVTTPKHTQAAKDKLSEVAKARGLGGYIEGSGRGKKGRYKGFYCDSSWELAYIIYCLDHNIKIERNTEKFEYTINEQVKNYLPDFLVEGEYVEIKGYNTEEWQAKLSHFPHNIKVLYEAEMQQYIQYAQTTYGKDFISLYE